MDISKLTPAMLATIPAMAPPTGLGHKSDFANPSIDGSNAIQTIIVIAVLTGLTVVVLLLRVYTKLFILRTHGWDDYMAVGATIGTIGYASLSFYLFSHGLGVHQWNVTLGTLFGLTPYMNSILYIYKPFMLMAKLSLCIFFFNLFGSKKKMRWAIYFAIAYNVILQVVAFFTSIFICIPGRPEFWSCSSKVSVLNVVTSGFNIFGDLYLLILPLFAIAQLQMRTRRKVALCLVFFVGALACVASILGLIYRLKQNSSSDVTWNFSPEIILVTFELEATIIVGCVMILPALFRSQHPLSFSSLWSNRSRLLRISSRGSNASQTTKSMDDQDHSNHSLDSKLSKSSIVDNTSRREKFELR